MIQGSIDREVALTAVPVEQDVILDLGSDNTGSAINVSRELVAASQGRALAYGESIGV